MTPFHRSRRHLRHCHIVQRDTFPSRAIIGPIGGATNPVRVSVPPQIHLVRIGLTAAVVVLLEPALHRPERSRQTDEDDEDQDALQPEQDVVQNWDGPRGVVRGNRDTPHARHHHKQHGGVLGPGGETQRS